MLEVAFATVLAKNVDVYKKVGELKLFLNVSVFVKNL